MTSASAEWLLTNRLFCQPNGGLVSVADSTQDMTGAPGKFRTVRAPLRPGGTRRDAREPLRDALVNAGRLAGPREVASPRRVRRHAVEHVTRDIGVRHLGKQIGQRTGWCDGVVTQR